VKHPETMTMVMRAWCFDPAEPDPNVDLPNEEWLSIGRARVLYSALNSVMKRIAFRDPHHIVLFVDQRVAALNASPLIDALTRHASDPIIVSPCVRLGGETEPWHEPINPYAWAARGGVLARLRPVWDHHLQFSHETLMAEAARAAGIVMLHNAEAVAEVGDGPATSVTNDLYYRQLEDAATVASVLGVEGPSA
jgi:hypothetical protein